MNKQSSQKVLLSKNEFLSIQLAPILSYVSSNLEKMPLRELAVILQGIAVVFVHQRQMLERGVKGLLSDINGDNLWNSVLKHRKKQLRSERQEENKGAGRAPGSKRQVRFRENGMPNDQIMDLKRLLDFT